MYEVVRLAMSTRKFDGGSLLNQRPFINIMSKLSIPFKSSNCTFLVMVTFEERAIPSESIDKTPFEKSLFKPEYQDDDIGKHTI